MSTTPIPAQLHRLFELLEILEDLAHTSIVAARKTYKAKTRLRRGSTLRPGPDTPLWNELARQCRPLLKGYGAKARLGRLLGLSRQRVHQLLKEGSACPDAERTLLLLIWLQARLSGRDFS